MRAFALPFLTLPDPAVSGEGALDPLGLAAIGDQLAEWILPGLRARMSRPRFLTAIAISALVCEGMEESYAADAVTPAHIIFEWLLVEGFAREGRQGAIQKTPGILKAREALRGGMKMSAKNYLKVPSVFGFHGVYKRLATNLRIVDDDYSLGDNGHALVKIWQQEQGIEGFIDSAISRQATQNLKRLLRSAVEEGISRGYTARVGGWQGWRFFANHLAPAQLGEREAQFIRRLLLDPAGDRRAEVFHLLDLPENLHLRNAGSETVIMRHLLPQASPGLSCRFRAIMAFEEACAGIEDAFDWLRYLSTHSRTRALSRAEFTSVPEVVQAATGLPRRLQAAERLLDDAPQQAQDRFMEFSNFFGHVHSADDLFEAVLRRHSFIQKNKPPEGKREWFEHAANGGVYVRSNYRLDQPPASRDWWPRPYRLLTVRNFCNDMDAHEDEQEQT
jgi:hypothetical protein